jgi:hypothetical protein
MDLSPETFELLLCLLMHFHEQEPTELFEGVDLGNDSATFVHAYSMLACLRILRANFLQLLGSPACRRIRDMLRALKRSADSFDDLSCLEDESMLFAPHAHIAELFRNVLLGESHVRNHPCVMQGAPQSH